ncbi:MAG: Molybdenum transport system permease protein ModB [Accumulibacter sp.]|uniref:molybdate ABC transporter permease subunit n=1 Tax=Accumulibacter sp. TaxID=2053492 RepID=UPI001222AE33|nr:molybdate ABC transporter permease subunit [Accumulibacter sp.]QKS28364.1 MAG: molybdate ABC transporter permease subunit [Candidatus Accumulibacter similis]TLD45814.1 MAG: Molybdenum transport system permease protein ModB [Accumulibacter sp.]
MDWLALSLSLQLAASTALLLLPPAVWLARLLAWSAWRGRAVLEAAILLPLVLPPTVLGYYLLLGLGGASPLGQAYHALTGRMLVFSFDGLLIASLIVNLPFAVQPMQRSFAAIPRDLREAAWVSGLSRWQTFLRIELPLAWPGMAAALALSFAHTLGEFGVVLMVGGSLPGETRTIAIAIYDQAQAFNDAAAAGMSALLLALSFVAVIVVSRLGRPVLRR